MAGVSPAFSPPFSNVGSVSEGPQGAEAGVCGAAQGSGWMEGAGQQAHPHAKASDHRPLSLQVWPWAWALGPWPRSPRRASAPRSAQVSGASDREGRGALGGGPASPWPPPGPKASRDLAFHLQGCDHLFRVSGTLGWAEVWGCSARPGSPHPSWFSPPNAPGTLLSAPPLTPLSGAAGPFGLARFGAQGSSSG